MRVSEPIYFRGKSDKLSRKHQRSILGFKESYPGLIDPHAFVRRRTTWDGTKFTGYSIPRVGEGVLPIRISKVSKAVREAIEETEVELYMETGVNDPINVGAENPLRLLPGNWQIPQDWADLTPPPNSGEYQGFFGDADTVYEADNVSRAVGEDAPSAAVYAKKLLMGLFPPSVFTGIQRLYMQAYYGANNELTNQFSFGIVGTQVVLKVGDLQLGFWSHHSGGIVRVGADNDLDFRYITISSPSGGGEYIVHEYPIVWDEVSSPAQNDYRDPASSEADKEKALAYLFAHSRIRWASPTAVGTFTLDNEGSDVAYGWKFNNAGTKASICLNELFIDGSGDWHFDSSEITVDFSYSTDAEGGRSVTLGTVDETTKVRWHSSRPVQIWVPSADGATCYRALTTPVGKGPTPYDYAEAPIYCWYDSQDELQIVKLSHEVTTYAEKTEYSYSNIIPTLGDPVTAIDQLEYGWALQDEARWYQRVIHSQGRDNSVFVGDAEYNIIAKYGQVTRMDADGVGGCGSTVTGPPGTYFFGSFASSPGPYNAPDHQEYLDAYNACNPTGNSFYWYSDPGLDHYVIQTGTMWAWELADIYIPVGDAEAVYVARADYLQPGDGVTVSSCTRQTISCQGVVLYKNGEVCWQNHSIRVWADGQPSWGARTCEVIPREDRIGEVSMYAHSRTLEGEEGAYDGSIDTYFFRDINAEDPPSKTFRESWGVAALRGSDLGTLDDEFVEEGTWTGWI